ncbi:hypothetical protein GCM10025868_11090 [Angustibacter aerolatus]|uniref:ABC3 transporter permease protein domain-containing protein n=1 Tax=Angustibacter aerolatus TaxID=1162965 RepID=A0ABQ6JDI6_9ACTN|nr:hypothetical protein [Angustibacter aerolatus]GMA85859.1 hypothetical protein GCM10025868_11090 [Angustibacter aerolatus]
MRDPAVTGEGPDRLHQQVVTGLPGLVADASAVADRTVAWTSTLTGAGTALGLVAVLAAAVLTCVQRRVEVAHAVGAGLRPTALGGLAVLEVLPVAVLSTALGTAAAIGGVLAVGPSHRFRSVTVVPCLERAGLAALVGVLLVGAATTTAALLAARLHAGGRPARSVPVEPVLVAAAVVAAVGLVTRPDTGGPAGPLEPGRAAARGRRRRRARRPRGAVGRRPAGAQRPLAGRTGAHPGRPALRRRRPPPGAAGGAARRGPGAARLLGGRGVVGAPGHR